VYVDPVQRRARWKLVVVGARKKLSNGWRAAKLARKRSAETIKKKNSKNTETDRKVIQQNIKTKTGMEEAGDEKKGQGHRV
jgi:hypothetical protein